MRLKILFPLLTLITINLFAQDVFEGVVKYKMVNNGEEMFMNYFTNGKNIKIDIKSEEEAVMITSSDKVIIVVPSKKMYMEFPASMLDMVKNITPPNEDDKEIVFNETDFEQYRTGETKVIHGYKCEKWFIEDQEGTSEIWLTDELGNFNFMQNPLHGGGNSLFNQFDGSNFFPLLMIAKDNSSNELTRLEATEVKKNEFG